MTGWGQYPNLRSLESALGLAVGDLKLTDARKDARSWNLSPILQYEVALFDVFMLCVYVHMCMCFS